jgi:hypothetical protein
MGLMMRKGNSTMLRERKNIQVVYNLVPSSLRNTSRSEGNTIAIGVTEFSILETQV